jgi:hypothetical protein
LLDIERGPVTRPLVFDVRKAALSIREQLEVLRASPNLAVPELAPQQLALFASLDRQLGRLETFPLAAIVRFDRADEFLTRLIRSIAAEANLPASSLVVSATSVDDYWADPTYSLVFAPTDWRTILGLPALAHELAHPYWADTDPAWAAPVDQALSAFLDNQGFDQDERTILAAAWSLDGKWLTELACDAAATYIAGGAYPWQHLRHMVGISADAFAPQFRRPGATSLHPADAARMTVCLEVLASIGGDPKPIDAALTTYVEALGDKEDENYRQSYPPVVLAALVGAVVSNVRGSVRAQHRTKGTVAATLNDAWVEFLRDQATYPAWELSALRALRAPR